MTEVAHPASPAQRTLITLLLMGAALMVVLDTTIANVALPHMQASLGATSESISWVLTSYILASAVSMPLTGWLADRLGKRLLFTVAVAGFTLSSALCGIANSLGLMVAARVFQGVFGAFIVPLSQAVMYDINPPERHVRAMMIWGIVVMIGPIMGPLAGGFLTENFSWRWVFFINVPIGLLVSAGAWGLLSPARGEPRPFDFVGFTLLTISLGSLQLLLERGTQLDWFDSGEIIIEAGLAVAALWMFVVHTMTTPHPIVPVGLFKNANFTAALGLGAVVGGVMMAGAALTAPMLQRLFDYSVFDAGLLIVPRGIGSMIGVVISARLIARIDSRMIVCAGMLLMALSLHMMTGFDLQMDSGPVIWSGLVQGVGISFVMIPLNLLAFTTLTPVLRTEGAALYSLVRNIGGSIAISVATALIARNLQVSHADLSANVTNTAAPFIDAGIIERLGIRADTLLSLIDLEINRQSMMIAYLDDFWMMMWASALAAPLVLLMRRAKPGSEPIAIGE